MRSLRYYRFIHAIVVIVVSAWYAPTLRAQNCSRNMLTITGSNSYVATPGVLALNLTKGFTIECWAKITSANPGAALVDKASYGIFSENDSTLYGMIHHLTPFSEFTPPIDSPSQWHHYAFVFTPGDSMRMYVDSIEVSSEIAPATSLDSNTDSLHIGMSLAGESFIGSIDELRIWNLPRSLSNIEESLYQPVLGSDSGLVLYYSFDDPVGAPRVHDFSGHARDGFIRGISAEIIPSSSPMQNGTPGFELAAVEKNIMIPTRRCLPEFDTEIHVRNLGPDSIYVDTVGPHLGIAFSIVPNAPFWLPPDSNIVNALHLHFEPNSGGVFQDSLYVASSSICGGRIVVGLQAAYDSVGLAISPDTLNFGAFTQCQLPTVRNITLKNTSITDSVTILSFLPPDSGFRVLESFPISLAPHQDTVLTVQLLGGHAGAVNESLGFELNKCSRIVILNVSAQREDASLSLPDSLNFGTTPSTLAGVTRDTTIIVTNSGDVPNAIATIGVAPDSVLEIIDGRTDIFKLPGDTLDVRVRMHATGCGLVTARLRLTSVECSEDTTTTLSITLNPPPQLTTPTLDLGVSCLQRDTTIFVSNSGDQAVLLDTITFSQNGIFQNAPFFPDTIAPHDSVPVKIRFDPTANVTFADTAYLLMSPCGLGSALFKGQLGFQGLAFSAPLLLLGRGCKTDTITESDTLTNRTSDTIRLWTNSYSGSLRFSVTPFAIPVILPPDSSKVIWVTYAPTLGALDTGTFTFLSNDGCAAAAFHLRGSREIANAEWSDAAGKFDTVCPGHYRDRTFDLIDRGIDSIDVLSASVTGPGFSLIKSPSSLGDSGEFTLRFAPDSVQDYLGVLTVVVDSCGTSFSLPLQGFGGPNPKIALSSAAHDFDSIPVGDSITYCIAITNPSCQPITAVIDSSALVGTPFRITQIPSFAPILNGDTTYLCVQFSPKTYGNFSTTIAIDADSISSSTISLNGVGLAPDVRFGTHPDPHLLDFGYVLINSSKTMIVSDSNMGNLATAIAEFHDSPVFVVQPPDSLGPLMSDSIAVTFNPVLGTELVYDTLRLRWDGHTDSIVLRGFGTEKGLQLSAVGLDFGNVHVGTDSTLTLYLFATDSFPTIDSISMLYATPNPRDTFYDTASSSLPYTIRNANDTLTLRVTYHARLNQLDTDYLVIHSGTESANVSLTAQGVEAHPWSYPASIAFPPTELETPNRRWPVKIGNAGDYPLYIDSIFTTDPAFEASPIAPSEGILPGDTLFDTVTFTPTHTRPVSAALGFVTSYRDSILTVLLSGSGIYSPLTGPDFGYNIPDRVEEPGQNDSIPVLLTGTRLAQINDDSVILDIRFDPQMVVMAGADAGTIFDPVSRFTHLDDSTIEVAFPMSTFTSGTIMRLYTQALLGPHDSSYIYVIQSVSEPLADQPSGEGLFAVFDCGGPVQGVEFAGPYKTNAIVPNPAQTNASLAFELGWDAPVTLDFYNAIGQNVRHIDMGTLNTGSHTLSLDVSDLPQGSYTYRLRSLDYHADGALVVLR